MVPRTLRRWAPLGVLHAGGEAVRARVHFIDSDTVRLAARGLPTNEGALAFLRSSGLGSWRAAARGERKGLGGEMAARRCTTVPAASSAACHGFLFITPASRPRYTGSIARISVDQYRDGSRFQLVIHRATDRPVLVQISVESLLLQLLTTAKIARIIAANPTTAAAAIHVDRTRAACT